MCALTAAGSGNMASRYARCGLCIFAILPVKLNLVVVFVVVVFVVVVIVVVVADDVAVVVIVVVVAIVVVVVVAAVVVAVVVMCARDGLRSVQVRVCTQCAKPITSTTTTTTTMTMTANKQTLAQSDKPKRRHGTQRR